MTGGLIAVTVIAVIVIIVLIGMICYNCGFTDGKTEQRREGYTKTNETMRGIQRMLKGALNQIEEEVGTLPEEQM
jgi:uncharacterized membrane protein